MKISVVETSVTFANNLLIRSRNSSDTRIALMEKTHRAAGRSNRDIEIEQDQPNQRRIAEVG